ncbi:patatin-like phospholipase family protein [Bradyrhizobium sp. U87765 SZCCT0131]|uniref:patatin-like phospholipase family protein n=1 Tax=unclassified Bradyrhizobium TaxID=2631580 RepID=UPI001BACB2FA|nr:MULTISPECIES: patatin-like phospholipase family protein [unclassified Bradyrhizobium]MBR1217551.1 patatin-like phospholipase family protein [Bradyrhizobium sp. U87765 SZCCT0131]MBR1264851.1 patatin-like phospholipase family protein [Bradyrhizobium sp. U87765 SZCCT0134]MBR1304833.1 patatin-like phospholipase family protein [Bradyrhizobium sp. U87765 SZCCT0110]MBR1320620.1 patatin-like phospholipase family protein [Bradyrhizobium sp. U87765 SZCCT0109]MBR1349040.1 patatin-like phospholipase fa
MDARTTDPHPLVFRGWRPDRCNRIALVLQGGGALGAYQAGVYQALHEDGIEPDWVCGVSIGAINSAIIAGNPPERRLDRLREFWDRITSRKVWHYTPDGDIFRKVRNSVSSYLTTTLGQPGFFRPHNVSPWLSPAGARTATSYYDTTPLHATLLDLVDFDLINARKMHFAVGAVNVLTGNFLYFDNKKEVIGPEHVMASGALPPALPMVKIGTDHFWDGGIVSNTPLQHLLDQQDKTNSLVFQVDLFSARGMLPRDIQEVLARHKDIVYSSRTRHNTDIYRRENNLKADLYRALNKIPDHQLGERERELRDSLRDLPEITILQLIYQQKAYEGHAKDYEFSATSMREHWQSGLEDTRRTLKRRDWLELPEPGTGIVVHDVHRENGY